jgi:hypothetical protein
MNPLVDMGQRWVGLILVLWKLGGEISMYALISQDVNNETSFGAPNWGSGMVQPLVAELSRRLPRALDSYKS